MDINTLRAIVTAALFFAFLVIVYWAFGPGSKHRFDKAANLPFDDEDLDQRSSLGLSANSPIQSGKPETHRHG